MNSVVQLDPTNSDRSLLGALPEPLEPRACPWCGIVIQ